MTKEMEALADKICKEELGQEPSDENIAFRKILVHGMVRWDEESKVKNLSSNPVLTVTKGFTKKNKKEKPEVQVCQHEWIDVDSGYNMDCRKCGKKAG